jgi:hypothetical protein
LIAGVDFSREMKHIVAIEPIFDPVTRRHVHHFLLKAHVGKDCSGFSKLLYTWAGGIGAFVLPEDVGIPVGVAPNGGRAHVLSVLVQTHFNHPQVSQPLSLRDSSGIRIHVGDVRTHNAGMMQLGDPIVRTAGALPIGVSQCVLWPRFDFLVTVVLVLVFWLKQVRAHCHVSSRVCERARVCSCS